MSSQLWQSFPIEPGLHALDVKDRLQEHIRKDTEGASPAELVVYFREASRRFRREVGRSYRKPDTLPSAVHDADQSSGSD
jgi:hypothetical protein